MAKLLFIGVLQCLAVLRCCELFASRRLDVKWESAGCVKILILRNMARREKDAAVCMEVVTSSNVDKPNFFREAKYF